VTHEELEAAALQLDPQARARLAGRLIESLENLSPDENAKIWIEEAVRRDAELDADAGTGREVADVLHDARARLK